MKVLRNEVEQVDELRLNLDKIAELKATKEKIDGQLDQLTFWVSEEFRRQGRKTLAFNNHQFTLVQAERTSFDEPGLKKALGARAFNKLTEAKLSNTKVKEAIENGALDPIMLNQYATVKQNKPSIRVSEYTEDE